MDADVISCSKELEPVGDYVDARFYTNQALPLSKELIHDLYGDTISGSVTRMESLPVVHFLILCSMG